MALKRQEILLVILAGTVVAGGYVWWPGAPASPGAAAPARGTTRAAQSTVAHAVPDVHLEALGDERPTPDLKNRNLFKFKPKPQPPPPPAARPVVIEPTPIVPTGPPPPPPLPPIGLRFIGLIERSSTERIAILSDGRGAPIYGKEGDAVLGQYKIVRIGTESIDMTYLDGRGRQTIRLSGS